MGLVGGLLAVGRALAHILHRQRTGDDQNLFQAALLGAFQHHATQTWVHRQARQLATQRGELALAINRREFLQQVEAVADGLAIRRLDKREVFDLTEAQMQHLQDHCRQVGTQDFRISKGRATDEVFLAVQANTDTRLDPPATALALIGAGLANGLNWQALDLGAVAVATDPCRAAVDYIANARHGQ